MEKEIHKMMSIKRDSGFTLIEILIAIAILAFGLLAVATMQVTGIRTNARANGLSQGLTLAQDKVEELMSLPFNHADLTDTQDDGGSLTNQDTDQNGIDDDDEGSAVDGISNFGLNQTGGAADRSETDGRYTVSWNVAVNQPATNSMTVRVIVTWAERGGTKRIAIDFIRANLS